MVTLHRFYRVKILVHRWIILVGTIGAPFCKSAYLINPDAFELNQSGWFLLLTDCNGAKWGRFDDHQHTRSTAFWLLADHWCLVVTTAASRKNISSTPLRGRALELWKRSIVATPYEEDRMVCSLAAEIRWTRTVIRTRLPCVRDVHFMLCIFDLSCTYNYRVVILPIRIMF